MKIHVQRWTREPAVATGLLLLVFLTINAVAVWGIVAGRSNARQAAQNELELRTRADARALEAILASLRADFLFLSQSPPLAFFLESRRHDDPMVRRWSRLDVEGTFLLFLEARPALERLVLRDAGGEVLVVAGRRQGVPEILPAELSLPPAAHELFHGCFPLAATGGEIRVRLDPRKLLALAAPGSEERLRVERDGGAAAPPASGELVARTTVADAHWDPPIAWRLVRREEEGELLRSLESLAQRYRTTVVLNLAVMTLTLVLGALAFRHARRAARLEADNAQEKRVRELERQLMHSERLASVGRLAAGLAHEINNPLEGMSNYLSLLADDLDGGRHAQARKLVDRVREGLDRTAGVTRQVLAFSGPGKAPKSAVDLAVVLRDAAGFVRSSRDCRRMDIACETDGALAVRGNPITLGQLFLNLVLNACQAQPEGGEVRIRAAAGAGAAVVTVADRGTGLSADALAHLFEPFFSTRGSTGLGLAVCHGIVTDHGGEIAGRNRPGGGAEFEVRLPLADEPLESPPPERNG